MTAEEKRADRVHWKAVMKAMRAILTPAEHTVNGKTVKRLSPYRWLVEGTEHASWLPAYLHVAYGLDHPDLVRSQS